MSFVPNIPTSTPHQPLNKETMPGLYLPFKETTVSIMVIQNLRTQEIETEIWEPLKSKGDLIMRKTGPYQNNEPTWETWEIIKTFDMVVQARGEA